MVTTHEDLYSEDNTVQRFHQGGETVQWTFLKVLRPLFVQELLNGRDDSFSSLLPKILNRWPVIVEWVKGSQDTSEPQSLIHTPGHWQVEELHGLSPEEQFSYFPWNSGYLEGLLKQIIEPPLKVFGLVGLS